MAFSIGCSSSCRNMLVLLLLSSTFHTTVCKDDGKQRQASPLRSLGRNYIAKVASSIDACLADNSDDNGNSISRSQLNALLSTVPNADDVMAGLDQILAQNLFIGATTALIPEANDAKATNARIADGESGDTNFPHGNLKPLATMGETSQCGDSYGKKLVGVPDGVGAYLKSDDKVRVIVQSESYGPLGYESYPYPVNDGNATFGASRVHYIDYDREGMAGFMTSNEPASSIVMDFGLVIEYVYNLKGEPVGPRNGTDNTTIGAHYGNTNADGKYVVLQEPAQSDWFYQSFCSAHLEMKYQWGEGLGFEDTIFMTNEEWMDYVDGETFVGLSVHAIDLEERTAHAVGVFTMGGFEKTVELSTPSPDHVVIAFSGYNGDFSGNSKVLEARIAEYGTKPNGSNYVWTNNIMPYRFYVGVKGLMEDGTPAPENDFLARNGLRYGQIYGFTIDMSESGPTSGLWRDAFHKDLDKAHNGAKVSGIWMAQEWRWNGTVRDFQHDGSWDYQVPPPMAVSDETYKDYFWWNAGGSDVDGCKTEHLTPDVRENITGYIQGSTCGYFGQLYIHDIEKLLNAGATLPDFFPGDYYVYQGVRDVTSQIELGGQGQYTDGRNATRNWSIPEGKLSFSDVDGLEVFVAGDGNMYLMIQEDSGNLLGERLFISSALEHKDDGKELTYYFVAMSGGKENSRVVAGVGIPEGTNCEPDANEFSGLFDLSGLLYKDDNGFAMKADDYGYLKRALDAKVNINDKQIIVNLQSHHLHCGIIKAFQTDRGGQLLMYQPNIPA